MARDAGHRLVIDIVNPWFERKEHREQIPMKLSIVTVCIDAERFIEETIKSVIYQSYQNLEYILVDGGSKDNTQAIIKRYAKQDKRVQWCVEPKRGISPAMNRGHELADGDFIAFLHADDRYTDDQVLIDVVTSLSQDTAANWLTGGIREINETGQVFRVLPVRSFSFSRLLRNNIIYHPATFVRLDVLRKLGGFDTQLNFAMDYDLWLKLAVRSRPVLLNRPLADFRVHSGSVSSIGKRQAISEEYIVKEHYLGAGPEKWLNDCYKCVRLYLADRHEKKMK